MNTPKNQIQRGSGRIRTVTVNDRGQIVIPDDIRKALGIAPNSTLVIVEKGGRIMMRKESEVFSELEGRRGQDG